MDGTGLMIDSAGLIVSAIAAVVVYSLYGRHMAVVPARGRRAVVIVALLVQAGVLLSAVRDRRNVALRLEDTESKLLQMEEIMYEYEKHNHDVVSNLATMLSKSPGNIKKMSYNKARSPDGTEKAELTVTMKDDGGDGDDQPAADDDHTAAEIMEAAPKLNDEGPPPSHGDGDGGIIGEDKLANKPWRSFSIPADHVFVLDCNEDGEITVHIRPSTRAAADHRACSSRQEGAGAAGTVAPFLSDRGTYHTLFLARPGEERFLPVPWPRAEMFQKVTDATLRGKESPMVHEQAAPESFSLSPDVVAFYRAMEDGTTELILAATGAVENKELSEEEVAWALTALTMPTILSVSFSQVVDTLEEIRFSGY